MSARKRRDHVIRRGPDGSAFHRCEECNCLVAIALADMHECGVMKCGNSLKRLKTSEYVQQGDKFQDQPRSAYCFFMEEFMKSCEEEIYLDADRRAFERWKNMTVVEKNPYEIKAEMVNSTYDKALLKEENDMIPVHDEADSAPVWKVDKNDEGFESFDSRSWTDTWGDTWGSDTSQFKIFKRSFMKLNMFKKDQ